MLGAPATRMPPNLAHFLGRSGARRSARKRTWIELIQEGVIGLIPTTGTCGCQGLGALAWRAVAGSANDSEDVRTAVAASYQRRGPGVFQLSVVRGPDQGATTVFSGSLPAPLLIGQSPVCEFRLNDPMISRRHVSLDVVGGRVRLRDLGSTNGTCVNGVLVLDALLCGGEEIAIGESTIRLDLKQDESGVEPPERDCFGKVLGRSAAMRRLYPLLDRLAASLVPVVIEGETGTGKEELAESLHLQSSRGAGPYVVFDCTAVAPSLVEAELFGHERGAFTGAVSARKGVFEQADGGTLLIDEIGDLSLSLQPKLLRALERSEIRRVGGSQPLKVDVRVIAATRRDLDQAVQLGRFRDDLFHRLAVARVELPPLSQRHGDVSLLARHFLELFGAHEAPSAELLARWEAQDWPGNVRELRNAVARYLALGELEDAPARSEAPRSGAAEDADFLDDVIAQHLPLPLARARVVAEFERRYIEGALEEHEGNVAKAAEASGVARRYFQLLRSGKRRR